MIKIIWNDINKTQPNNNVKCIVQWKDGTFHIDYQKFGEWSDKGEKNIIKWAFLPDSFIDDAINFFIKYSIASSLIKKSEIKK